MIVVSLSSEKGLRFFKKGKINLFWLELLFILFLFLLGLLDGVGLEVVSDALVDDLQVASAAGTGSAALNGLDGPVETSAGGTGVGAGGATLPLLVEGVLTAATAGDVGASVASTLRGSTLGHCCLV